MPPIVLLDEARTALDPENESFIRAAIGKLVKRGNIGRFKKIGVKI